MNAPEPVILILRQGAPHPRAIVRKIDAAAGVLLFSWAGHDDQPVDSGNSIARFTPIEIPPVNAGDPVTYADPEPQALIDAILAPEPAPAIDIATLQDELLESYTRVELLNITPAGAIEMAAFIQAGGVKALAVRAWIAAHWAEFRTKQASLNTGTPVDLKPSSPWKPYSYTAMAEEFSA